MEGLNLPQVSIEIKGAFTKVFINGKEVEGVTKVQFIHDKNEHGSLPRLSIELLAEKITLKTSQIPTLPEIYIPYYAAIQELLDAGIITESELVNLQNIRSSLKDRTI